MPARAHRPQFECPTQAGADLVQQCSLQPPPDPARPARAVRAEPPQTSPADQPPQTSLRRPGPTGQAAARPVGVESDSERSLGREVYRPELRVVGLRAVAAAVYGAKTSSASVMVYA
ncbi:hypothetical protein GCM10009827_017980 [Dactylosporangium maewongense]|uniref:Uncharacterized protein n=1 Tax=Dactylosporangium maewongense TaxID=634393 RepID=A0ABN1ZUW2_9ACTN